MKKLLSIAFLTIVFIGCSTHRKVNKEKIDIKSELEATREVKTDGTTVSNSEIKYGAERVNYGFKPIDKSKPMKIDGKEYFNVEVDIKTEKETADVKNEKKETLKKEEKEKVKEKTKTKAYKKVLDKKGNSLPTYLLIPLILLIIIFLVARYLYLKYKKINPIM